MTSKQIPWKRFGLESILIVSSILVALAVDSWWEYRNEREYEQDMLSALLSEFERNKAEMERALDSFVYCDSAAKQLLSFSGQSLTEKDLSVIDEKISWLGYYTFDPSSGALDSLMGAGQLDLILNIELRNRLAGWTGLVRDYKEDEQELDYFIYRELEKYLRPIVPLPNVADASPGQYPSQWQEMYNDIQFLNLVGNISYWTESTIEEASLVGREIAQIIELIENEIE